MKTRAVQDSLFSPPARRRRLGKQVELIDQCFALLERAIAGDMVTLLGVPVARFPRPRLSCFVQPHCGATETLMLGCLSCRQPLASLLQLLWHLEASPDQTHVIARQCGEHGWEAL